MSTKVTSVELSNCTADAPLLTDNSAAVVTSSWVKSLLGVTKSLTPNGYIKLFGITIQWGNTNDNASSVNVSFPTAFASAVWFIVAMPCNFAPNAGRASPYVTSVNNTGAVITSAGSTGNYFWLAIGD